MIELRPAKASDAQQIAPIMLLAMEDIIYHFIGESNKQEATCFLAKFIAHPDNQYSYKHILVAVENNEILGQICLYPGEDIEHLRQPILDTLKQDYKQNLVLENETQAGEMYLDTIAVSEKAQGKGIGKKLLQYAIDEYVHKQHQTLGLLVDKENPNAKKLYLQVGFQIVGEKFIFQKEMEHLQYAKSFAKI